MRRPLFLLLLLALGLVAESAGAGDARLLRLRHGSLAGNTRVVIELSRPVRFESMRLEDPPRAVVDLDARSDAPLEPLVIEDARVARVRPAPLDGGRTRIVVDLKAVLDYRVFEVPADGDKPHRIVIDFFGVPAPAARSEGGAPAARSPEPPAPAVIPPPVRTAPITVLIDAGHGGQDPGARGADTNEKEICLAIARRVAAELNRRPGYRARLTRDDDFFIPLRRRIEIAEKAGADAFVSVHCNASRDTRAHGTEVYFLSLSGATDEASRELARLENAADLMGGVAPEADDDLSSILFDMQQTDVLQRGSLLAEAVVNSLREHGSLSTRGVKQAGFAVLKSPRIPSILVEAAFITHQRERQLLRSGDFQGSFARRLADGIIEYFQSTSLAGLRP